jgi:hypothetical protein
VNLYRHSLILRADVVLEEPAKSLILDYDDDDDGNPTTSENMKKDA